MASATSAQNKPKFRVAPEWDIEGLAMLEAVTESSSAH